jgi:hypothetical protein
MLKKYIRKFNPEIIIARGPFATNLALNFKDDRKICFDGRGAYVPELMEYNVVPDEKIKSEIESIERRAVLESNFRIAVSNALVNYWKEQFQYKGTNHVVIPCTLNSNSIPVGLPADNSGKRNELGFKKENIIIAYSGSNAGWQTLEDLTEKLIPLFRENQLLTLLLMLKDVPAEFSLKKEFPDRVHSAWVKPEEVTAILSACDYGWMVREKSVTNKVASPVKFAEYLVAGLPVIISEELGDYPEFVLANKCGIVWNAKTNASFLPVIPYEEKLRIHKLALEHFSKENFKAAYQSILK